MRVFLKRLIRTAWLGSIWSVGYLVAPILFETLDDRALAGLLAGKMFTMVAWISLVAGPLMALLTLTTSERSRRRSMKLFCIAAIMACMVSVHWVFTPMMDQARLPDGSPGEGFLLIHGGSSLVYLLGSLLGLVLLWPGRIGWKSRQES
jgi:hypothetical protein